MSRLVKMRHEDERYEDEGEEELAKTIKLGIAGIIILVLLVILGKTCLARVPAGYVAVQYSINGGIKDDVLTQGWHIKSPTTKTTLYTVGLEQSYLTGEEKGDSKKNESFTASSSEGKSIAVDLTFTYQYEQSSVTDVFTKFKGQSGTEVRDSFIKPNIVSWTKEVMATYKVADILGAKRGDINAELTKYLAKKFEPYGITITNVSLINLEVDEETRKAINNKITAQQNAETQAIQNQTNIDKANADAQVKKTEAQADADAKLIKAEAEAEANRKLNESLTDNIVRNKWVNKWDGKMPTVTNGGNTVLYGIGNE